MSEYIDFEYVKEHGDFGAVLSHYGFGYQEKGTQLRALCPFHDDINPSLDISTAAKGDVKANTFHCHGCNASGSLIDYVSWIEEIDDLREASRIVANISGCELATPKAKKGKYGGRRRKSGNPGNGKAGSIGKGSPGRNGRAVIKKPEGNSQNPEKRYEAGSGDELGEKSGNSPLKFSLKLDPTHPYLATRVDPKMVSQFGLGQCDPQSRSMMAGRICIPIHNDDGEVIAYAGRYASDEVPNDTEKYLLPPNFAKKSALFNVHRVIETDFVVIVEGYFGAMRLFQLGVPVVAIMGTSMFQEQVDLLLGRGVKRVLVMLDGDDAGGTAIPPLLNLLTRSFFVKVGYLPDGEAPDTASDEVLLNLAEPINP